MNVYYVAAIAVAALTAGWGFARIYYYRQIDRLTDRLHYWLARYSDLVFENNHLRRQLAKVTRHPVHTGADHDD